MKDLDHLLNRSDSNFMLYSYFARHRTSRKNKIKFFQGGNNTTQEVQSSNLKASFFGYF